MSSAPKDQQRYRVLERLAAGGMAEVFLAESAGIEGFKKQVAIKRVLPHLSKKERFIRMFLDEARLSAHLSHSNVVQVFDIGVGDNTYFIVMEYVDGADLKAVIEYLRSTSKSFPIEVAVLIGTRICEGLAYAHERTNSDGEALNAVHRDISPPNVLLSMHGEIKIVDFGLAKASTQLEKSEAGIIKGKFHYLSPEAAHGKEVDARADIFAVGIILWEMLAGRRLFTGKSDYQTVKAVQRCEIPPITKINPEATPQLESILQRALARDADKRYKSARTLGQDLTRCLFRMNRPVSAFDIAELVRGPMLVRKGKDEGATSIIDKLISETLFEFTSLTDEEKEAGSVSGARLEPFSLTDFQASSQWAEAPPEADQQAALLVRNTLPADVFEEGNLAALEGPEDPLPREPSIEAADDTRELLALSDAPPPKEKPLSVTAAEGTDPNAPPDSAPVSSVVDSDRDDLGPDDSSSASPLSSPPSSQVPSSAEEAKSRLTIVVLVVAILAGLATALYFGVLQ